MVPRGVQHPDVGMRPASWVSSGMIHVDMTGYGLAGGRPIGAAIQRDPAAGDTVFTQEPAYAAATFAEADPKIVVRPGPDYAGGLESVIVHTVEKDAFGAVDFATGLTELPGLATRPAPSADTPLASLFAHSSPAAWWGSDSATPMTILDARESSGTSLAFSWDLDGNGSYGDDPRGGWVMSAPPSGTAYVPLGVVWGAQVRGSIEVGVRVTTPSGGEATKRLTLPVWRDGAGGGYAFRAGAEDRIQPEHGTLQANRSLPGAMHFACLDIGDDGTWDRAPIETFPVFGSPGLWSFPASWIVSLPPGRVRVAIAYYSEVVPAPSCTATGAIQTTSRFLVTRDPSGFSGGAGASQMERSSGLRAAAPRARQYRATARLSVRGGRVLSVGTFDGRSLTWRGIVSAGRFIFPAPVRARGTRRPAAMDAFASGTFAMRADTTIGSAPRANTPAIAVGTSTMLIRGAGGMLGCFRIVRTSQATTWTLTGGTGAARRLDVTLTGAPTTLAVLQAMERRRVIRPSGARYAVRASLRATSRSLSAGCRALRGSLPARG